VQSNQERGLLLHFSSPYNSPQRHALLSVLSQSIATSLENVGTGIPQFDQGRVSSLQSIHYLEIRKNGRIKMDMKINIGINETDRKEISEGLSRLLADTYTLYLKTHNFHWNVTGPMFQTLHLMFETQYMELATAVDLIAERIRALGFPAPATYAEFSRLSSIKEEPDVPNAQEMIRLLVEGQEAVVRTARQAFKSAEKGNDQPTEDLLTQRMQTHEKTAWMLRSLLA
jgi:starvation-inducible DNA-binding protein